MALVLGDKGYDRGQRDHREAGRLGVVGTSLRGQRGVTVRTRLGHEGNDFLDPFGGQQDFQAGGMTPLTAGLALGLLLDDGLGGMERIGRGRDRGVGGILAEAGLQVKDTRLLGGDLLLEGSDGLIALTTAGAGGRAHTASIRMRCQSVSAMGLPSEVG